MEIEISAKIICGPELLQSENLESIYSAYVRYQTRGIWGRHVVLDHLGSPKTSNWAEIKAWLFAFMHGRKHVDIGKFITIGPRISMCFFEISHTSRFSQLIIVKDQNVGCIFFVFLGWFYSGVLPNPQWGTSHKLTTSSINIWGFYSGVFPKPSMNLKFIKLTLLIIRGFLFGGSP